MIKKHLPWIMFTFVSLFLIMACTPPLYYPNNRTIFDGDTAHTQLAQVAVGGNGFDLAIAKKMEGDDFVFFDFSYDKKDHSDSLEKEFHKHYYGEFGYGTNKKAEIFNFNLLLGTGLGITESYDNNTWFGTDNHGSFIKGFLQFDGSLDSPIGAAGLSSRFSYVYFYNAVEKRVNGNKIVINKDRVFYEPTLFLNFGSRQFRIETQLGLVIPVTPESEDDFSYEPGYLSIGIKYYW